MRKKQIISLLLVFIFAFAMGQKQSSLYFKRAKGSKGCKMRILIGNQPDLILEAGQVAEFKIFSSGKIKINVSLLDCAIRGYEEVYLEVEPGKEYFIDATINTKQVLNLNKDFSETWEWRNEVTLVAEEDKDAPINISYYKNSAANTDNGLSSGTGFMVSDNGYIITNYHVIDNAINIKVKGIGKQPEKEYLAKLIASDKNNDLALLQLDDTSIKPDSIPFTYRFKGFETGDDIFVLGYPMITSMGEEIKLTKGIISSKTGYQGDLNSYQVSAQVQPGNSGSPVFDVNGNIIGIINSKIVNAEGVSYAIKPTFIQSIFQNAEIDFVVPEKSKTENLSLSEKTKIIAPFVFIIIAER